MALSELHVLDSSDFELFRHIRPNLHTDSLNLSNTMPGENKLWVMESPAREITPQSFPQEKNLEDFIMSNPKIIETGLLLIDRQHELDSGDIIDILGMTIDGWIVVLELKRGNIDDRETIGQIIEYGSEIRDLNTEEIKEIYDNKNSESFREGYVNEFGIDPPKELNRNHSLILGGTGLEGIEESISYLYESHSVTINGIVFDYFNDDGQEYTMNSWFNDPYEVWDSSTVHRQWPKSHYLTLKGSRRDWRDWLEFNFIQAGGGTRYRGHMEKFNQDDIVYVYRPHGQGPSRGYLGVGKVTEEATPLVDFQIERNGDMVSIQEIEPAAEDLFDQSDDPENCEYFVRVEWLATMPNNQSFFDGNMLTYRGTRCEMDYTKEKHRYTLRKIHSEFDFTG